MTRQRRLIFVATCALALVVAALSAQPTLVWNATPSYPEGLYRLVHRKRYQLGDLVYFAPPDDVRRLLYDRHYIPQGGQLMKQVVALAGDTYCVRDQQFFVRGRKVGPVFILDFNHQPLPQIRGCFVVPAGQALLASPTHRRSFDSRYFGSVPLTHIHGLLEPLWTW